MKFLNQMRAENLEQYGQDIYYNQGKNLSEV